MPPPKTDNSSSKSKTEGQVVKGVSGQKIKVKGASGGYNMLTGRVPCGRHQMCDIRFQFCLQPSIGQTNGLARPACVNCDLYEKNALSNQHFKNIYLTNCQAYIAIKNSVAKTRMNQNMLPQDPSQYHNRQNNKFYAPQLLKQTHIGQNQLPGVFNNNNANLQNYSPNQLGNANLHPSVLRGDPLARWTESEKSQVIFLTRLNICVTAMLLALIVFLVGSKVKQFRRAKKRAEATTFQMTQAPSDWQKNSPKGHAFVNPVSSQSYSDFLAAKNKMKKEEVYDDVSFQKMKAKSKSKNLFFSAKRKDTDNEPDCTTQVAKANPNLLPFNSASKSKNKASIPLTQITHPKHKPVYSPPTTDKCLAGKTHVTKHTTANTATSTDLSTSASTNPLLSRHHLQQHNQQTTMMGGGGRVISPPPLPSPPIASSIDNVNHLNSILGSEGSYITNDSDTFGVTPSGHMQHCVRESELTNESVSRRASSGDDYSGASLSSPGESDIRLLEELRRSTPLHPRGGNVAPPTSTAGSAFHFHFNDNLNC